MCRIVLLFLIFGGLMIPAQAFSANVDENPGEFIADPLQEIRVLLFSQLETTSFLTFAHEGSVLITTDDGFRLRILPGQTGARIFTENGNIVVEREHVRRAAKSFRLTADSGFMRILHPESVFRYYNGSIELSATNNRIEAINTVLLEDYVASVVGGEMDFEHPEVLKIQAIIARTYALWNFSLFKEERFDLTDHILNQVYIGEPIFKPHFREAAEATAGQVITYNGRLILASYHSTCGGHTAYNESVWSGNALPYLRAVNDHGFCDASPHSNWTFTVTTDELHNAVRNHTKKPVTEIQIENSENHGRVTSVRLNQSENGVMGANEFRLAVNQVFGYRSLKSSLFELETNGDDYIFTGRGMGHGVGLCQWGALGMAENGIPFEEILRYYFTGTELINIYSVPDFRIRLAQF